MIVFVDAVVVNVVPEVSTVRASSRPASGVSTRPSDLSISTHPFCSLYSSE